MMALGASSPRKILACGLRLSEMSAKLIQDGDFEVGKDAKCSLIGHGSRGLPTPLSRVGGSVAEKPPGPARLGNLDTAPTQPRASKLNPAGLFHAEPGLRLDKDLDR